MSDGLADLLAIPESRKGPLQEIAERAAAARSVVLVTHVNADGDGTGSEAAVAAWLEEQGTPVTIVNPSPFPASFAFLLHREGLTLEVSDPRAADVVRSADLVLVLDTSEANRVSPLDQLLDPARTLVLDHHPPGPSQVGRGGLQDPTAAATGELVYDLITMAGGRWNAASVLGVYVAIVTDTGSFRFSNTTPRAHAIAADLLDRGVDPEEVFQRVFAIAPRRRLDLLREALTRLEHDPELGLAWMFVPRAITEGLGTSDEDYDGLIDHARSLEGTRVALLFRETGPNTTKVSLRSSGRTNVNRIAREFGGGGHVKASGASLELPAREAIDRVVARVREVLREEGAEEGGESSSRGAPP